MELTFRQCTAKDVHILWELSRSTFCETFAAQNTEANLHAYLEQAYSTEKLRRELADPNSFFYFLYADGALAGYLKLNECPAQTDIHDVNSIEIERIYVSGQWQGKGLGTHLINKAVAIAHDRDKSYLWLGVWENNAPALAFYRKHGFQPIGSHDFIMGDEAQTDLILRKDL